MPDPTERSTGASASIYETCVNDTSAPATASGNGSSMMVLSAQEALFQCLSSSLEMARNNDRENLQSWFLVLCGALVFSMQVGFAMLCAGCVRKKNLQKYVQCQSVGPAQVILSLLRERQFMSILLPLWLIFLC
jgi:hypothetical protein